MLASTLIAAFAVAVRASSYQDSEQDPIITVDPNAIDMNTRISWCTDQQQNCPIICGQDFTTNNCSATTLEWTCECAGTSVQPNISSYAATVPSYECITWRTNCIAQNAGNNTAQTECMSVICGNKVAAADELSATSSSATSSATSGSASSTTGASASAATSSAASASPTHGAAAALDVANSYGGSVLMAVLVGMFGFAL